MEENYLKSIASNLCWISLFMLVIMIESCGTSNKIEDVSLQLTKQNIILEKYLQCDKKELNNDKTREERR